MMTMGLRFFSSFLRNFLLLLGYFFLPERGREMHAGFLHFKANVAVCGQWRQWRHRTRTGGSAAELHEQHQRIARDGLLFGSQLVGQSPPLNKCMEDRSMPLLHTTDVHPWRCFYNIASRDCY